MKSAYEIAMERMGGNEAVKALTDEQKAALADLDQRYKAKIAEKEIFLGEQIRKARQEGDRTALDELEKQLRSEKIRLEEERDTAKEKIRAGR